MYFFLQRSTAEEDEAGEAGANRPRLNEIVLYIFQKEKHCQKTLGHVL